MTVSDEREREARRARRAWIAANHPDHGGDPHAFAAGLRRIVADAAAPRPTVYRSRSPVRRVRAFIRQVQRARRGLPPRNLR